ncbi:hypothetical protein J0A68_12335 [Algoriphagus sp. H41]|uniref:Uncharacterized protein n=1 Tax=Algoriphagus oliviformis TaxID=2811231 RepID=A0ABS3C6G0_9BACT|nr:hypothetical protein [Algoriphagus oliviformis]MBN7811741.1 hypothetical protein [Algoriphagus oliviformis]
MVYVRVIILLMTIHLHSICKGQSIINEGLEACVEHRTVEIFKDVYGENSQMGVYEMASLVEGEFKSEGFLNNVTKEDYLRLVEYIYSNKRSFYENDLIREFSGISGLLITSIVIDCPYEIVVKERNKLNSSLVLQLSNASELQASGYEKEAVIDYIDGIDEIDFSRMVYRAPVIVILLFHLENVFRDFSELGEK